MIHSKTRPADWPAPAKRRGIRSTSCWAACLAAAALAMLLAVGARADEPATSPATAPAVLTDHDLALLHQLESGSWRERKSAEAELSALPSDSIPIISAMLAFTKSAEATTRLQAVLAHLKTMGVVGATLISMHMKDAPAKAVYAELFKQDGGTLKTQPAKLLDDPTLPKLSIDVDHQPFWAVIEKLQSESGLTVAPEPDSVGGCYLTRGGPIAEPHTISGPFLITLGTPPARFGTNGYPSIVVRLYAEPRLNGVLGVDVKVTQAVDDKGNVLEQGPQMIPMITGDILSASVVRFKRPEKNPGTRLVRFVAMVTTDAAFASQRVDIGDLMKAAPQTIPVGKLNLKFKGCKLAGGNEVVSFSTSLDPQMRAMKLFENKSSQIHVFDGAGHELTPIGTGFSGGGAGGSAFYYAYSPAPEPRRLVFDVPSDVRSIDDPVHFKDLNVPLGGL